MVKVLSKVVFISVVSSSLYADTIKLRADAWCPYNCDPKTDKPGFIVEIAKYAFEKAGHKVDYQLLNWARTLREVKEGTYDGAVGASTADSRDLILPNIEQGTAGNSFFVRIDDSWTYKDEKSMDSIILGTIRDYSYGEVLDKYIGANKDKPTKIQVASGDDALDINMKKVVAGRMDALIENEYVAKLKIKEMGFDKKIKEASPKDIKNAVYKADPVYIAFSPKNPKSKEYAEILSKETEELRKNGKLKEILAKYGLDDWKK